MANNPVFHQQLAMYFSALPCPPLPILASREHAEGDHHTAHCSFDLIANYLIMAIAANDPAANRVRQAKQVLCEARLLEALPMCKTVDDAYTHYQRYTADYLCAFAGHEVGARFAPLRSVDKGDPTHSVCCQWNAGQDILHVRVECARATAKAYSRRSYLGLLQAGLDRFRACECEDELSEGLERVCRVEEAVQG